MPHARSLLLCRATPAGDFGARKCDNLMLMSEKPKQSARYSVNIAVQTTQTCLVRLALVMEQMGIATLRL